MKEKDQIRKLLIGFFIVIVLFSCDREGQDLPQSWEESASPLIVYQNTDSSDGPLFEQAVGEAENFLLDLSLEVVRQIYDNYSQVPKIGKINFNVGRFDDLAVAGKSGRGEELTLRLNSAYLRKYYDDHGQELDILRAEMESIFAHELTHIYSPYVDNYSEISAIVEGLANMVSIKLAYRAEHWAQPGGNWQDGYDSTAFFLLYLEKKYSIDLLKLLTQEMVNFSSLDDAAAFLKEKLASSLADLWEDYQSNWPWPSVFDYDIVAYPAPNQALGQTVEFMLCLYFSSAQGSLYGMKLRPAEGNAVFSVGPLSSHKCNFGLPYKSSAVRTVESWIIEVWGWDSTWTEKLIELPFSYTVSWADDPLTE